MEDTHNYSLALRVPKKNPMTIEINKVDPSFEGSDINKIEVIDTFTSHYTKEEIVELIKKSNTITDEYLPGKLIVIDNKTGWRYKPLVNEGFNNSDMLKYLSVQLNDKNKDVLNQVYNKAKVAMDRYGEETLFDLKEFFLGDISMIKFLNDFRDLPYLVRRSIRLVCTELYQKEQSYVREQKIKERKKSKK